MIYEVRIQLDDKTLAALQSGNWQLQAYKGCISTSAAAALPTVWHTVDRSNFTSVLTLSWGTSYGGYFSNTEVKDGVKVDSSTQKPMQPGDIITLLKDGETEISTTGGKSGAFSFLSNKDTTWTCGMLVEPQGGTLSPICAFPQYGAAGNIIEPYEKVLLLFTQDQTTTGSVVQTALTKSISCILSTDNTSIDVDFNINHGWDAKGNPNARENPVQFNLASDLIIPHA